MNESDRKTALAAACVLAGFGVSAYFLPSLILGLGGVSPLLGGVVAVLFVVAFFGVFWLRGRYQTSGRKRRA